MAKGNKMMGFIHYNNTKEAFINAGLATTYNDAIVFIKGDSTSTSCIYTHGQYFASTAEAEKYLATIPYFKGIVVNGKEYNSVNGGGYLALAAADPATITVNVDEKGVTFGLSDTFKNTVASAAQSASGDTFVSASQTGTAISVSANVESDLATSAVATKLPTAAAAKNYADSVANSAKNAVLGTSADTKDSKTIEGVIKLIDDKTSGIASEGVVNDLSGRVKTIEDNYASKTLLTTTIEGLDASKEGTSDHVNVTVTQENGVITNVAVTNNDIAKASEMGVIGNLTTTAKGTIVAAINELVTSVGTTADEAKITVEKENNADYAAVYVIKQNGTQVGEKINIPKDMVVTSGSYDANTKELVLVLANSTTDGKATEVRIPASGLVDVYEGSEGTHVNIAVSDANIISATVNQRSITATEIADETILYRNLGTTLASYIDGIADYGTDNTVKDAITTAKRDANAYADSLAKNYATSAQGTKADSAVQDVVSSTTSVLTASKGADNKVTLGVVTSTSIEDTNEGLTTNKQVKTYVDSAIETAFTWEELS